MIAYTDYPFIQLGDIAGEQAPVREVKVLSYDDDKYCTVKVQGCVTEVKAGYIYEEKGRFGEVPCIDVSTIKGKD